MMLLMKKCFAFVWFFCFCAQALPGKVIGTDQVTHIPIVSLESIDLTICSLLTTFNPETLPSTTNWKQHQDYYQHRNRSVYVTADERFAIKVWEKQYASAPFFLKALHAGFYDGITRLAGIIYDQEGICRGYIT